MRFLQDQTGAVAVLFVVLLPILLGVAGLAIDYSAWNDQRRYVQHAADVGALAGIRRVGSASEMRQAVRETVAQNRRYRTFDMPDADIILGTLATDGTFRPLQDQNAGAAATALAVIVRSPARPMLLSLFLPADARVIARTAIAATEPRVSFALSNCLLQATLFREVLRPILGADLDVLCGPTLARTRLDLADVLGGIALDANLLAASGNSTTWGDILNTSVDASRLMSRALGRPLPLSGHAVRLGDVVYMPADLRDLRVSSPLPPLTIGAQDMVMAAAQLLMNRVVDTSVAVDLGGLRAALAVKVGDPGQIVIGAKPGDPLAVARTAQIDIEVGPLDIRGILDLRLALKVATASARLTDAGRACAREAEATVAVFDPARAAVLDLALGVKALGLPVSYDSAATKSRRLDTVSTQRIGFTRAEHDAGVAKTFGPIDASGLDQVLNQLMSAAAGATDDARRAVEAQKATEPACTGLLGCLIGGTVNLVVQLVNGVLSTLSATVPQLAGSTGPSGTLTRAILADLLALRVANADLRLLDLSCAAPGKLAA